MSENSFEDLSPEESKKELDRIQEHIDALGEYWDTVQIFCTRVDRDSEGEKTAHAVKGKGNWFAVRGQIKHWLIREDQKARLEMQRDFEADDDDE